MYNDLSYSQSRENELTGFKVVKNAEFTGYREPSYTEHSNICNSMYNNINAKRPTLTFWYIILIISTCVCAICSIGNLLLPSISGFVLLLILTVLSALGTRACYKRKKHDKELLDKIYNKDYSVLECGAYKVGFSTQSPNNCALYIYNRYNEKSVDKIIGSNSVGISYRKQVTDHLLLIKCGDTINVLCGNGSLWG